MAHDKTGGLWPNRSKGGNDRKPNYLGQVTIDGKTHFLSAWYTDGQGGRPTLSLRVNDLPPTQEPAPVPSSVQVGLPDDFDEGKDDDIPF